MKLRTFMLNRGFTMIRTPGRLLLTAVLTLPTLSAGCGGKNTPPTVSIPGAERSVKTKGLEAGAMVMQDKTPVDQVHMYVCGFHFYGGDMTRQVEAHHYCIQSNEDFAQCLIFSGNDKNARLIGIEYIISAKLFETLPEDERKFWHSHDYEVKSGTLIAPGLPVTAEHELMEKLITTYGKTIHTWQVDRGDTLPLGAPQLMMAFTRDGQVKPELVEQRDRRFGVSTPERKSNRSDIPTPTVLPGADAWQHGPAAQLEMKTLQTTRASSGSP